ncbi:hypothetical protein FHW16_001292 [Phyllobacterium myrsinacearum]|uniref:Uncharacterized protein n=1 Tax=Phyllobacterium myrsinacearum TaxID=28101 RepID=A0A839ELP4_9HYPH|nr:hypothetical protein [Phyllobacterium myrsinacearum]
MDGEILHGEYQQQMKSHHEFTMMVWYFNASMVAEVCFYRQ